MDFNNVSPGIVIISYILFEILKKTVLKSKKSRELIPLFCSMFGVIIGILIYFFAPEMLGYPTILESIATGGLSAMAATGCNQLYKKVAKSRGEIVVEDNNE